MVPTHKNKQGARGKEEPKKPASLVPELVIDPIREEPEHESSEYEEVETKGPRVFHEQTKRYYRRTRRPVSAFQELLPRQVWRQNQQQ